MSNFPPEFIAHRLRLNPSSSRQITERIREASLKGFYKVISELADPNISADDELFYLMVKAAVFRGDYTRCFEAAGNKKHPGILSWKAVALARTGQVKQAQQLMTNAELEAKRFGDEFVLLENLGLKTEVLYRSGKTQESYNLFKKIIQDYHEKANRSKNLQNALFVAQIAGMKVLSLLGKHDEIREMVHEILPILNRIGDRYWKSQVLFILGHIDAIIQGNLDQGYQLLSETLNLSQELEDAHGIANCFRIIGEYWMRKRDYNKANDYFEQAKQYLKEIGDLQTLSDALISLANVRYYMGHYEEAKGIYQESHHLKIEIDDEARKGEALMGIANCEGTLGNYNPALLAFKEALRNKERLEDLKGQALLHSNIGKLYFLMSEYEQAEPSFLKGLEMFNELNHKFGKTYVLMFLGKLSLIRGNISQAKEFLMKSLQLSEELGGHVFQIEIFSAILETDISKEVPDISNAKQTLSKIIEISQQSKSKSDQLWAKYIEGFFHLNIGNLEQAEGILNEVLPGAREAKEFELILKILLELSQIVIDRYTLGEEIKSQVLPYLEEMSRLATEKHIYPVLYRCWITQAILAASSLQFDESLRLIKQALNGAKERKLNSLLSQVEELKEMIEGQKVASALYNEVDIYIASSEGQKFQSLIRNQIEDYLREASMLLGRS